MYDLKTNKTFQVILLSILSTLILPTTSALLVENVTLNDTEVFVNDAVIGFWDFDNGDWNNSFNDGSYWEWWTDDGTGTGSTLNSTGQKSFSSWMANGTLNGTLPDVGSRTYPSIFQKDSETYMIVGENAGGFYGFQWNKTNSSWFQNETINASLPKITLRATPSIFRKNSNLYMISGTTVGSFHGFQWSDATSSWSENATINATLPDLGSSTAPTVFMKNDALYMIAGFERTDDVGTGTGFAGFQWSETTSSWSENATINASLPNILTSSVYPNVFFMQGIFYLIFGETTGVFRSYSFNESNNKWIENKTINSTLVDIGSDSSPYVFNLGNTLYLMAGELTGQLNSFVDSWNIPELKAPRPGSNIWLSIISNDGTINGSRSNSSKLTVNNTLPVNPTFRLNSTTLTNHTSGNITFFNLTATTDADDDTTIFRLRWFKEGTVQTTFENFTGINSGNLTSGNWTVEAWPYDFLSYGTSTNTTITLRGGDINLTGLAINESGFGMNLTGILNYSSEAPLTEVNYSILKIENNSVIKGNLLFVSRTGLEEVWEFGNIEIDINGTWEANVSAFNIDGSLNKTGQFEARDINTINAEDVLRSLTTSTEELLFNISLIAPSARNFTYDFNITNLSSRVGQNFTWSIQANTSSPNNLSTYFNAVNMSPIAANIVNGTYEWNLTITRTTPGYFKLLTSSLINISVFPPAGSITMTNLSNNTCSVSQGSCSDIFSVTKNSGKYNASYLIKNTGGFALTNCQPTLIGTLTTDRVDFSATAFTVPIGTQNTFTMMIDSDTTPSTKYAFLDIQCAATNVGSLTSIIPDQKPYIIFTTTSEGPVSITGGGGGGGGTKPLIQIFNITPPITCGDGTCSIGEDRLTCEADCGEITLEQLTCFVGEKCLFSQNFVIRLGLILFIVTMLILTFTKKANQKSKQRSPA